MLRGSKRARKFGAAVVRTQPPVSGGIELVSVPCPLLNGRRRELVFAAKDCGLDPRPSCDRPRAFEVSQERCFACSFQDGSVPGEMHCVVGDRVPGRVRVGAGLEVVGVDVDELDGVGVDQLSSRALSSSRHSPRGRRPAPATSQSLSGRWSPRAQEPNRMRRVSSLVTRRTRGWSRPSTTCSARTGRRRRRGGSRGLVAGVVEAESRMG